MQHKPLPDQMVVVFGAPSGIGLGAPEAVAARGEPGLDPLVAVIGTCLRRKRL